MKHKHYFLAFMLTMVVILGAGIIKSGADREIPNSDRAKEVSRAPQNSPVINDNWELERRDFVHYAKPAQSGKKQPNTACYKLLGIKWPTLPIAYTINPTNNQGIDANMITSALFNSAETWDAANSKELFNNSYTTDINAKYGVQDYKNVVVFGDYPNNSAIAVTSIWSSKRTKQIIETDMIFNTRFQWGNASIDSTKMDIQNIATHEFGHVAGLDDLYTDSCTEITMFGYSNNGETKKQTLEAADIQGLNSIYR